MKTFLHALLFAGIGYYSAFYFITDPAENAFLKISLVYGILSFGFIYIYRRDLKTWFYIYIGIVYLAITIITIQILKLS